MDIAVIGAGYTGLVVASCFAEMGNTVVCLSTGAGSGSAADPASDAPAQAASGPDLAGVCESGLDTQIRRNQQARRLSFSSDLQAGVENADICIVAVGEPSESQSILSESAILECVSEFGNYLPADCLLLIKSTVSVGTADRVSEVLNATRAQDQQIEVVSNPEFMKVGTAVSDFMSPDRIILGCQSDQAKERLTHLYQGFARSRDKILFMGRKDAELTKFAATAMLATRISLMNEIALISEQFGADIEQVRRGIGSDSRIGYSFIYPGCGYGGAQFTGDVRGLIASAAEYGIEPLVLGAVEARNQSQKQRLFEKLCQRFGNDLNGRTVAIWGLAFKPGVEDMHESAAVPLIESLARAGARIKVYDPACDENVLRGAISSQIFDEGILECSQHQYDAALDADALVLVTEWKPFRQPDFAVLKKLLKQPVIFDGRNQYDPAVLVELGFEYSGIGRVVG